MNRKIILYASLALVALVALGFIFRGQFLPLFFKPTETTLKEGTSADDLKEGLRENLVSELRAPWDIAFIKEGEYLVTERSGNLKIVKGDEVVTKKIEDVYAVGEGGLLGLALHPEFSKNNYFYLFQTVRVGQRTENRVDRYVLLGTEIKKEQSIISGIPGGFTHNGGRIAFGPDEMLYITTGDAGNTALSQNTASLAGKILRVTDGGQIPADNPFGNAVFSYGHRNPQGLAWDEAGRLWATEHGPSANDELNLIKRGANYGWPTITGTQTRPGMESPIITSGSLETWAPSGMVHEGGRLFFVGLRGQALYEAEITGNTAKITKAHFRQEFGRLRQIVRFNDSFYILTNNTDGRGTPKEGDDRIIKIPTDFSTKD